MTTALSILALAALLYWVPVIAWAGPRLCRWAWRQAQKNGSCPGINTFSGPA